MKKIISITLSIAILLMMVTALVAVNSSADGELTYTTIWSAADQTVPAHSSTMGSPTFTTIDVGGVDTDVMRVQRTEYDPGAIVFSIPDGIDFSKVVGIRAWIAGNWKPSDNSEVTGSKFAFGLGTTSTLQSGTGSVTYDGSYSVFANWDNFRFAPSTSGGYLTDSWTARWNGTDNGFSNYSSAYKDDDKWPLHTAGINQYRSNIGGSTAVTSDAFNNDTVKSVVLYVNNPAFYFYIKDVQLISYGEISGSAEPESPVATADGASIRLGQKNGMRFYTTVDMNAVTALNTESETVSFGTLIGPANLVGDELDIEDYSAGNAVDVVYGTAELWDNNQFVGSIVNIKEANLTRDFVARGYVKIGDTYYYSGTTATRNVAAVADAFIADEGSDYAILDPTTKALVDHWAAAND